MRPRLDSRFTSYDFWRTHEPYRPATHRAVSALTEQILDEVTRYAPLTRDSLVLDVGAGNGAFTIGWERRTKVVALDYSHSLLLANPVKARVEGSVFALPFRDSSFDLVFSGAMLHHIDDVEAALREMRRVSRRYVAAMEPNRNNPAMAGYGLVRGEERGLMRFTADWLGKQAQAAGLRLMVSKPFGWILPNKVPGFLVAAMLRLPPESPLSFHLVLVAEK